MSALKFEPADWSRLHGGITHFPIALLLVSVLCEFLALLPGKAEWQWGFRFTASFSIIVGALGSYVAVFSGLVMARGQLMGHGAMLRHHQFVWPAFALMTVLAGWRISERSGGAGKRSWIYLGLLFLAAGLMSAAGYWGGELLNRG